MTAESTPQGLARAMWILALGAAVTGAVGVALVVQGGGLVVPGGVLVAVALTTHQARKGVSAHFDGETERRAVEIAIENGGEATIASLVGAGMPAATSRAVLQRLLSDEACVLAESDGELVYRFSMPARPRSSPAATSTERESAISQFLASGRQPGLHARQRRGEGR
jgi:hypothetical protein